MEIHFTLHDCPRRKHAALFKSILAPMWASPIGYEVLLTQRVARAEYVPRIGVYVLGEYFSGDASCGNLCLARNQNMIAPRFIRSMRSRKPRSSPPLKVTRTTPCIS